MAFLGTFKAKTRVIGANMDQKLEGFCERGSAAGAEKVTPLHIHSSNEARAASVATLRNAAMPLAQCDYGNSM